jgi:hypothetical protein
MLSRTHTGLLTLVAATALTTLAASAPARAEEPVEYLGPVGPHHPILASVGDKRVIAYYLPDNGRCALQAIVWNQSHDDSNPERVRISLGPNQMVHIDGDQRHSLNLQCGDNAKQLSVVDNTEEIAFGAAE